MLEQQKVWLFGIRTKWKYKRITDKNVVALFEIKEANLVAAVLKDEIQLLEGIKVVKTIKIEKPLQNGWP